MKHIFRIFTGVLPDYFLLNSASTQNLMESLSNFIAKKEKNVYNKQKIQVLWHENYHISLVATATHEIFIFIPLDENKSCIYRKNLNILYLFTIQSINFSTRSTGYLSCLKIYYFFCGVLQIRIGQRVLL